MKITKRNGNVVVYDDEKIIQSILKASAVAGEEVSEKTAAYIAGEVFARLSASEDIFSTEDVRKCVYKALYHKGYTQTAKIYAEYKK
ncbi:MAG: hypothetical protein K6F56_02885 [Oscillospiraceae bacterium]|nr:hypothetical protein [Oscillospiraceae bacterium]